MKPIVLKWMTSLIADLEDVDEGEEANHDDDDDNNDGVAQQVVQRQRVSLIFSMYFISLIYLQKVMDYLRQIDVWSRHFSLPYINELSKSTYHHYL